MINNSFQKSAVTIPAKLIEWVEIDTTQQDAPYYEPRLTGISLHYDAADIWEFKNGKDARVAIEHIRCLRKLIKLKIEVPKMQHAIAETRKRIRSRDFAETAMIYTAPTENIYTIEVPNDSQAAHDLKANYKKGLRGIYYPDLDEYRRALFSPSP